jgi:hypothetical protein
LRQKQPIENIWRDRSMKKYNNVNEITKAFIKKEEKFLK